MAVMRLIKIVAFLSARMAVGLMPQMACESECASQTKCIKTFWSDVMQQSNSITSRCPIVVYTVSTEPGTKRIIPGPNSTTGCNIAFVAEGTVIDPSGFANWEIIYMNLTNVEEHFHNSRKASRVPKITPKYFFKSETTQYAVYMDNVVALKMPVQQVIDTYMKRQDNGVTVMAAARHPWQNSLRGEFDAVLFFSKDRPRITHQKDVLQHQYDYYTQQLAWQPNLDYNVIFDGGFLVHNIGSPVSKKWRCEWYAEYVRWADRDQVSGIYLASKMSFEMSGKGRKVDHSLHVYNSDIGAKAYLNLIPRPEVRSVYVKDVYGVSPADH